MHPLNAAPGTMPLQFIELGLVGGAYDLLSGFLIKRKEPEKGSGGISLRTLDLRLQSRDSTFRFVEPPQFLASVRASSGICHEKEF